MGSVFAIGLEASSGFGASADGIGQHELLDERLGQFPQPAIEADRFDGHGVRPRQAAEEVDEAFQPLIATQGERNGAHRLYLHQQLLDAVATHRVADRPDRFEPRQRKRRQKNKIA